MRKIFAIILSIVMVSALFACTVSNNPADDVFDEKVYESANDNAFAPAEEEVKINSDLPEDKNEETVKGDTEEIEGQQSENTENGIPNEGEEEPEHRAIYIRAKVNGLNVRSRAGSNSDVLGSLDKNDMLMFYGEENGWYKTRFRNRAAYVSAGESYTELYYMDKSNEEIERVIEMGCNLLGTPYVYGATRYHNGAGKLLSGFSIDAFDCSSLMQFIYFNGANVCLDLTTRTQIKQGVSVGELKRGDLMFFTNASRQYNSGIERVGHVAMYLGDNYILHTASDHAVIEEISATRWGYFLEARRVLFE